MLGHRGGNGGPENSARAFAHGLASGATHLETDARTTRDGVAVLVHDHRPRGGPPVEQTSRAELAARVELITLEDALTRFPDARFCIDIKDESSVTSVTEVLLRCGGTERVCITSFSDRRIDRAVAALPAHTCVGMGVRRNVTMLACALLLPHRRPRTLHRATVVQPAWGPLRIAALGRRFVAYARRHGIAVHVWTVNDEPAMRAALELGVHGIVSDDVPLLRAVVDARR